ncbi:nuclear transport factor 2 family protein [Arthrobacter echini]|uniref:Nuclear transport factor 2 family protein n=1 Tax=Arthrobacter echini TaxID=1529066 RepID=A0A4S5E269_9MICC|nr:nuclear transport factor 2 family protein [Arthrobacter echini]THJ65474.1 nuclear transport factor 2 family protein [Arthrobacter echini]
MDYDTIRAAEEELLTSAVRHDPTRVEELLHPDFVEIGRSGNRWTRSEIVAALADEAEHDVPVADEWTFYPLGQDLALVTYLIREAGRESRHSSIWAEGERGPVMRFHQGTTIATSE